MAKLDKIGFCWNLQEEKSKQQFLEKLERLKQWKEEHGSFQILRTTAAQRELSTWASKQRHLYKQGLLEKERQDQLDAIDFVWATNPVSEEEEQARLEQEEMEWMEAYQTFKKQKTDYVKGVDADSMSWLIKQKKRHTEGMLLNHRQKLLEEIGVEFQVAEEKPSVLEKQWNEKLERLLAYQQEHNTLEVPTTDKDNIDLVRWTKRQRLLYLAGRLEQSRQDRLTAIGFDFRPPDSDNPLTHDANWDQRFARLEAFKYRNGHTNITSSYKEDLELYRWARRQRELYNKNNLDPDRQKRLESLGFSWAPVRSKPESDQPPKEKKPKPEKRKGESVKNEDKFEQHLAELKAYKDKTGHTCVPRDYKPNPSLSHFVANQRKQYKAFKMPEDRKRKLEALGFVWNIKQQKSFDDSLERLKSFKSKFGHTNVPCRYKDDPALGSFVNFQRRKYREEKLPAAQKKILESIGFEFEVLPPGLQKVRAKQPELKTKAEARVTVVNEKKWNDMLAQLQRYKETHGHCNVPLRDKDHPKLGKWVSHQRLSCVRKDRRAKLDLIGFVWDASYLTSKKRRLDETSDALQGEGISTLSASASSANKQYPEEEETIGADDNSERSPAKKRTRGEIEESSPAQNVAKPAAQTRTRGGAQAKPSSPPPNAEKQRISRRVRSKLF
jgi:hypothetical protein